MVGFLHRLMLCPRSISIYRSHHFLPLSNLDSDLTAVWNHNENYGGQICCSSLTDRGRIDTSAPAKPRALVSFNVGGKDLLARCLMTAYQYEVDCSRLWDS